MSNISESIEFNSAAKGRSKLKARKTKRSKKMKTNQGKRLRRAMNQSGVYKIERLKN